MTDRELLELAAKAAGMGEPLDIDDVGICFKWGDGFWNPLTDDGDALRLATDLELNVFHTGGMAYAIPSDDDVGEEVKFSYRDVGGKHIATRRAIVRAAAKIGKEMS